MLRAANLEQERAFMRTRRVGEGSISEREVIELDDLMEAKDPAAKCFRCGADFYYTERDTSYAIWCANYLVCKTWSIMRGI